MKKKYSRKLELCKETIQALQNESLSAVAGGGISSLCPSALATCPLQSCGKCPDNQ